MTAQVLWTSIIAVFLLGACQQQQPASLPSADFLKLSAEVSALAERVRKLELEASAVNEVMSNRRSFPSAALLTPGDSGYSSIMFDFGVMLVSLQDVKPYAGGTKVTLLLGNPTTATITGTKAEVMWGPMNKSGQRDYANPKTREISFPQRIPGGTLVRLEVVLDDVPPERFGWIGLKNLTYVTAALNLTK